MGCIEIATTNTVTEICLKIRYTDCERRTPERSRQPVDIYINRIFG